MNRVYLPPVPPSPSLPPAHSFPFLRLFSFRFPSLFSPCHSPLLFQPFSRFLSRSLTFSYFLSPTTALSPYRLLFLVSFLDPMLINRTTSSLSIPPISLSFHSFPAIAYACTHLCHSVPVYVYLHPTMPVRLLSNVPLDYFVSSKHNFQPRSLPPSLLLPLPLTPCFHVTLLGFLSRSHAYSRPPRCYPHPTCFSGPM